MRLKFWQSETESAPDAQAVAAPSITPRAKPAPAAESPGALGDLDLRLVWNALLRKNLLERTVRNLDQQQHILGAGQSVSRCLGSQQGNVGLRATI